MKIAEYYFKGIDCPNCAAKVEAQLNKISNIGMDRFNDNYKWGDDIESEVDNSQDWVIQFLHDQINPQKYGFKENFRRSKKLRLR